MSNFSKRLFSLLFFFLVYWVPNIALSQVTIQEVLVEKHNYYEQFDGINGKKNAKHGAYVKFQYPYQRMRGLFNFGESPLLLETGNYHLNQKEGQWQSYYDKPPYNTIKSMGFYNKDKKVGYWTEYWPTRKDEFRDTTFIYRVLDAKYIDSTFTPKKEQGLYLNDLRTGPWNFYDIDEHLIQRYDYSKKSLIALEDNSSHLINDHEAAFLGGMSHFSVYIRERMHMVKYKNDWKNEVVIFELTIAKTGEIVTLTQQDKQNISNFDSQIKEILKNSEGMWIPGRKENILQQSTFIVIGTSNAEKTTDKEKRTIKMSFKQDFEYKVK
jgi:hypothetical protein